MPRKNVPLRLDPAIYDAIAQLEVMLRDNLRTAGRLPKDAGDLPKRGRPRKDPS